MSRTLGFVGALTLFAASCGGGGDAVIERQVNAEPVTETPGDTVCGDIEAFALGSHDGADLSAVIAELARLSAIVGANDALPHLAAVRSAVEEDGETALALDAAAAIMDEGSHAECEIPVFTALYVSTSFSSCFGRAAIPAATMTPDTDGCEPAVSPGYLPCFDAGAGFVPIDCRSGTPVVVRDGDWVPAAAG